MIGTITKMDALFSLAPTSKWSITDDVINWYDETDTVPTDAELATEITRLQGVYDGLAYARARKKKYDLLNQDEMRFDDQANSTTTWVDAINAIKAAHPKP